jgi:hypothetical protein
LLIIVKKDNTYEDARKIETLERGFYKDFNFQLALLEASFDQWREKYLYEISKRIIKKVHEITWFFYF